MEKEKEKDINSITADIIDAALKIHRRLGPGLLESVYETLLAAALMAMGYVVRRQVLVPLVIDGIEFEQAFRADLIVADRIVVEIKAQRSNSPIDERQILTYTKLLDFRVGLLLNFGGAYLKDGIVRVVNALPEPPRSPRNSAPLR